MTAATPLCFEPFDPPAAPPHPPPQECWRAVRRGQERARLSLWWQGTPPLKGERLGTIGALSATDPADAVALLHHGCGRLAEQGCTGVLAPMDGSTWGPYRCRLEAPLGFAGEPVPGPRWQAILAAAGFHEQSRYLSSLCADLEWRRAAPRARRHLAGVSLRAGEAPAAEARTADLLASEALALALHRLVQRAFGAQPWFRPLPAAAFVQVLRARLGAERGPMPLLAWADGEPVGLLLGHRAGDQLVVRTLAVLPERRFAGVGALLLEEAHGLARAAGCRTALHALMLEGGPSHALSRHYARPVAHYALMARPLP